MRSRNAYVVFLVLCVLCGFTYSQDFKTVRNGVEYAEVVRTIDNQPVRMNLLRLDLKKVRLDVVHAMNAAIGTETVSSMAMQHHAFAAINAGFFRLDTSAYAGDPAGIFQIDGKLFSEANSGRIAVDRQLGQNMRQVQKSRNEDRCVDRTFEIVRRALERNSTLERRRHRP